VTPLSNAPEVKPESVRLPRQLSDAEFALFRSVGHIRIVEPGETLFRKGGLDRSMFVIEHGEIHLEFGDGLAPKRIGEREFLGELALFIGDHQRVASAVATVESRLLLIDHAGFEDALAREPALIAHFMRRSFTYLVASEQRLVASLKRRNEELISTLDRLRQKQTALTNANTLVRTDELTGLANRRGLYRFLETFAEQRRPDTHLALFLIDIDSFKSINDRYGHLAGDRALCLVANELSRDMGGKAELCCRLGGDEFALLVQIDRTDDLDRHAARFVAAVRDLKLAPPHEFIALTVSIGATLCDEHAGWSSWYGEADSALYAAKGSGGNNWRIADAGL